jgi:hypothetical protein
MANTEPKVRTRTKKRGDTTIVKTVTKERLPGGGKVKTRYVEKYTPEGVTVRSREKVKGAEDIAGRKQKMSMTSFKSPSYEIETKKLKEKGPKEKRKSSQFYESEMVPKEFHYMMGRKIVTPKHKEETTKNRIKTKSKGSKEVYKKSETSGFYNMYGKKIPKETKITKRSR